MTLKGYYAILVFNGSTSVFQTESAGSSPAYRSQALISYQVVICAQKPASQPGRAPRSVTGMVLFSYRITVVHLPLEQVVEVRILVGERAHRIMTILDSEHT